ncbi:hypothetical protein [uncultured Jatrophihabitans sp.]|uniref:hypothetical protein n=1 Tax=uncultured Jatrophihabitans sp. TaxID=1610747 RepID=UPI0035CA6B2D
MTGFDPTAPDRDTDRDEPEVFEDNVVPPNDPTDTTPGDARTEPDPDADRTDS